VRVGQVLWGLARSLQRRFVGSTSSLTVTLCQLYFLITRYRPVNTSLLSSAFQNEVASLAFSLSLSACVCVRSVWLGVNYLSVCV
jgi:hypothetical protein